MLFAISVVSWTKLTLHELKKLCVLCGLSDRGNKEDLGKRLHLFFEKRKGKQSEKSLEGASAEASSRDNIYEESQEADKRIRDKITHYLEKKKEESVPINIFLSALGNLEKKIDKSFSALHLEIKEAMRVLPTSLMKDFADIRNEIETQAITLRLADNKVEKDMGFQNAKKRSHVSTVVDSDILLPIVPLY
ncbi:12307_t:CDS:2 [Cetraspora pellucida]|uniref:12307_t:CDS:1 n=1 Tax=Cetraspora pellucida TaxID=1433469 RepID=A0A9N8WCW4_9GLOM|nr:12307_t:CDS:2 [Cetraspora pellucida]